MSVSTAAPLAALGPYDLLVEVASGGMATVYVGRRSDGLSDAPLVAIKRPHRHLATDKAFLTMLVDEARLASAIDHPNVAKVRELRFHEGAPFIVMDYVEGASLADLRRELGAMDRRLDARLGSSIALDALEGLQAAHELKDAANKPLTIIHRDVSPHNILVGCNGQAYLTDFGIAKAQDRIQTTRTHEVKGKLAYLAPERIDERRICTVQSDVFSMGVVLWECFAGRRLFRDGEVFEVLHDIVHGPIPRLRDVGSLVPAALDEAIERALSRDLGIRFPSARAFADAIAASMNDDRAVARADVASLMGSVFERTIRERRAQIAEALDRRPRLAARVEQEPDIQGEPPPSGATYGTILDALAPKSSDGRYLVGTGSNAKGVDTARHRGWMINSAVWLFGLSMGGALTAVLMHGWAPWPRGSAERPAAVSATNPTLVLPENDSTQESEPTVLVSGNTSASAAEVDGADAAVDASSRPAPSRLSRPIGTVRDGFTKLR